MSNHNTAPYAPGGFSFQPVTDGLSCRAGYTFSFNDRARAAIGASDIFPSGAWELVLADGKQRCYNDLFPAWHRNMKEATHGFQGVVFIPRP
jgi:hypothetical protein